MAAHLPELLWFPRCSDVSGALKRFEFVPNLSRTGDLGRSSCLETLLSYVVRIEDLSPSKPPTPPMPMYYNELRDLYVSPLDGNSAFRSYFDEHVDRQRAGAEVGGERATAYRWKCKKKLLRFALPLDYLEKALRSARGSRPHASIGHIVLRLREGKDTCER